MLDMFKKCDRCGQDRVYMNRVKIDGKIQKYCDLCMKETQTQTERNAQDRVFRALGGSAYVVSEVTVNEKRYTTLRDNQGYYVNTKDLLLLAKRLVEFSNIEDIDESLQDSNAATYLENMYGLKEYEESGLYKVPENFLYAEKKQFDLEKRNWSFKCGNCSEKVGTKTHRDYYVIQNGTGVYDYFSSGERACSPECSTVIAKDLIKNNFRKYKKYIVPLDDWKIKVYE